MRLVILTETLIILDIKKAEVNDCIIRRFQVNVQLIKRPKLNKLRRSLYRSELALLEGLVFLAEISPPCEIPGKICFCLHERRVGPSK